MRKGEGHTPSRDEKRLKEEKKKEGKEIEEMLKLIKSGVLDAVLQYSSLGLTLYL